MSDETIQIEPQTHAAKVRIRVVSGPHIGMSWTFVGETSLTIGRQSPSNLRFPEERSFSREHLRLEIRPPYAELFDNDSNNGTRVNGMRVAQATLSNGDHFGSGETQLVFELVPAVAAAAELPLNKTGSPELDAEVKTIESKPSFSSPKPVDPGDITPASIELTETVAHANLQPTQTIQPRNCIGVYVLLEKLGEGGMATVYRAKHQGSTQEVALKLIRASHSDSQKLIQLFAREASILSQLNHPRIVKCLEFGIQDGQPFLVMELIETINLVKLVDSQSLSSRIKTSCWVASRILQALTYAHERKFVHRDIKPGNILAYREAHRLQVKLADFGLAKCYENAGFSAMTDDVSMRGTIAYMAPEQIKSSKTVGPLADVFATGACLYRLLVGKHPPMAAMGVKFSSTEMASLSLPQALIEVVEKSMQVDPKNRYLSAAAMEIALRPFHGKA